MARPDLVTRFAAGMAVLVLMLAMSAADAGKRMPVRTQPIPDTESGRPAGSAEPANPNMIIYGPPVPPLGAPPAPPAAAPAPEPAAKPAPETMPNLPFRRNKKRAGFLVMEGTTRLVVNPRLLQLQITRNKIDYVEPLFDLVNYTGHRQ